ncbi:NAD-dependent epimerase/dehydratase family protein [Micromonospora cathayae]|uniref:NAD-dependent epimerase/dehydratase family protein n=1 Tax=Micromonospora cathayae TaxID=3028804 RepID=A0ABY7ZNQ6_9ACTN|nr:NAD-dependent epimerase/dehydratase family protein [Micromonospora sp. HUAS 3]WDZ83529.1 NAD-dependent epimerase/dehydratase family protein [Micromonospora sp. HUAS 3]
MVGGPDDPVHDSTADDGTVDDGTVDDGTVDDRPVVVTGGSGMLGGFVVRRLRAEGVPVRAVDLRVPERAGPGVTPIVADVRDAAAMRRACAGAAALVHCAAALPSYAPGEIRSVIVDGTRTVLTAARAAGVDRVVHVSTTAVYGLPTIVPTPEEHPREPVDAYGRAKSAAEEVAEEFRDAGLCVPVLRPKTFLGPGRMGLFAMLFEWAEEGRHFPILGRGDARIQMCDVDDLTECVLLALRADPVDANDTFNVAAAEFGTFRQDVQAVLDAAGHGRRVVSVPARPALLTLQALRRARLSPVYDRLLHKLLADSYVSVDKVGKQLGFTPRHSNRDALLRTFAWWRTQRAAGAGPSSGRTSREPWSQGALRVAKAFF